MSELIFSNGSDVLFRAALNARSLRVGQSPLNDLMLADDGVAAFQASVERTPDGFVLIDRSGQGTHLNGKPTTQAPLTDGDRISLGRLTAVFNSGLTHESPATRKLPSTAGSPAKGGAWLVGEDGRRWPITEAGIRVGKDPSNELVLEDGFISSFHALIFRRGSTTVVKDLGSTNGTFINSIRITEAEAPPQATLTLGRLTLTVVDEAATPAAHKRRAVVKTVGELIYADPLMEPLASAIRSVAPHDAPVCITGESGSGKELVARAIHQLGTRAELPFVAVNCAAISPQLVESELFGHEKGAFTGADRARVGAFEEAGKGTLFLDEVGELPADVQAKLLRALENREIRRVGAESTRKIACRILTATHQNLSQRVKDGAFRNDLFHRLAALPIRVPPLRERPLDVPVLTEHVLRLNGHPDCTLSPSAMEKLKNHPWPGNVRELKNVLMQAAVFSGKKALDAGDIAFTPIGLAERIEEARVYSPGKTLADIELDAMEQAIEVHGSQAAAARELGIARSTMVARLAQKKKR